MTETAPLRFPTAEAFDYLKRTAEKTLADIAQILGDHAQFGFYITEEEHPWHETWRDLHGALAACRPRSANTAPFKKGDRVWTLTNTSGGDHEDAEHYLPAGMQGEICDITTLPEPQGLAYTVAIFTDDSEERNIVNVFDAGDGPITDFIEHL